MRACWLDPAEQSHLCESLLRYDLLKYSQSCDFLLSSGQSTDIYINIREARNHPEAIEKIARYYRNPLLRLAPDRFIEVPHSVSCFAGVICVENRIPYLTVRDEPKFSRATSADTIGSGRRGDKVCIIDDVITNGASKIRAYRECHRMGFDPIMLVVLIDRQQGWKTVFVREGIKLPVWAGMTLHDVRRFLIESGNMMRCDPATEKKNPIIVALDGKSWEEVLPVIDRLRPSGCILKVNDLLFDKGIDWLLPNLSVYGRVMADIKGHDIESTLGNIAKHFLKCPPWAVTVHASGGEKMIAKVVEVLKGTPTKVLAVTVLTSFDEKTGEEIYVRKPMEEVAVLAAIAERAGADGFVCASAEAPMIRNLFGSKPTIVTPGVRSPGADPGDQKRCATPRKACEAGADHIIMGRQFFATEDPVAEVERVLTEELGIS